MPGLTVDTSPPSTQHHPLTQTQIPQIYPPPTNTFQSSETVESQPLVSSSASPSSTSLDRSSHDRDNEPEQDQEHAPPYSPLTPTLAAARLSSSSRSHDHGRSHIQHDAPRHVYTHTQPAQTGIAPPPPVPIAFEDNPDALALKSAISILQLQRKTAERDVKVLKRVKDKAMAQPDVFLEALGRGEVKSVEGEAVLNGEDEAEGDDGDVVMLSGDEEQSRSDFTRKQETKEWERLPKPQNVVRCPPINWSQYAVIGDSLEKLHQDQLARPNEGSPQRFVEGQYYFGGEGQRRPSELETGLAAPYMPGKDKMERMGTRKGGKR